MISQMSDHEQQLPKLVIGFWATGWLNYPNIVWINFSVHSIWFPQYVRITFCDFTTSELCNLIYLVIYKTIFGKYSLDNFKVDMFGTWQLFA